MSRRGAINGLCFASMLIGVGIGIFSTAQFFKDKYETMAKKTIEEAKEDLERLIAEQKSKLNSELKINLINNNNNKEIPDMRSYHEVLDDNGYTDVEPAPYIIAPDDYGGTFEYDCITLIYYRKSDVMIDDDTEQPIEDYEDLIGPEALDHFGEYSNDSVFVRNDAKRCDYEVILEDEREWTGDS